MINWLLTLTNEQRKISLDEAEQLSGISAKALEKDWWVTLTLKFCYLVHRMVLSFSILVCFIENILYQ